MGRLRDIQEDKAEVKFDLDLVTLYTIFQDVHNTILHRASTTIKSSTSLLTNRGLT